MPHGMAHPTGRRHDTGVSDVRLESSPDGLDQTRRVVATAVAAHRGERGPLLAILHDVVAELGHVPDGVVADLAEQLNLSRAEVHGVVSFYKDLRTAPPGHVVVQLCRGEACQSVGAENLVERVAEALGVTPEATRDDGAVTLDEVFCLGNCALGPSGRLDGRLHGRLTADRVVALAERALAERARQGAS